MDDIILLKLGEIVLKGLNRKSFELKLIANARRRLRGCGEFEIYCVQSTIYVEPENDDCDMDEAFERLKKLFGIVSLNRAAACEKDVDAIFKTALAYLAESMEKA
ncbi:MAG: tRNA 4-thiouridine(8) synthase ThiI, partial [Oscillospiraceae bacterium]